MSDAQPDLTPGPRQPGWLYEAAFDAAATPTALLVADSVVLRGNAALAALLGRSEAALVGAPLAGLVEPDDLPALTAALAELRDGRAPTRHLDARFRRDDATLVPCEVALALIRDEHDLPVAVVVAVVDVSNRVAQAAALLHAAEHDALTGLANRALVARTLRSTLVECAHRGGSVGVLLVDLDRFKDVNDTYGHAVGDQLLVAVAARVRHAVRQHDLPGRIGGDEFVVVAAGRAEDQLQALAARVTAALGGPVAVAGQLLHPVASVGLAVISAERPIGPGEQAEWIDRQAEELLRRADQAMYAQKRRGRSDRLE